MRVCFLSDFGTRLLALDAGFTDMGGGGTAADDYHPASQPLLRHANNIIGIEMTKTLVPNVDASPGSRVISDQCSLRRVFTLSRERVKDRDMSQFGDREGGDSHNVEVSMQVALIGNCLALVKDRAPLANEPYLGAALSKM